MKIQINEFKGIMPKLSNDKLPPNMAQTAADMKTASKALVAYSRSSADTALGGSSYKSLFEYSEGANTHWIYYDLIVHWVRAPVADDTFERMYLTGRNANGKYAAFVNDIQGGGAFDFTTDFYYPGAPAAVANGLAYTIGSTKYRAYFYTYVSRYGEEGPPSAIVETVDANGAPDWDGTSSCVLSGFTAPIADDSHLDTVIGANAPAIRIYRTSTDGLGNSAFLLVSEIAVDNTGPASTAWAAYTFTDTDDDGVDGNLGSACETSLYDRAPDDLTGLRGHPGGWFVAHKDNMLYFSEPYAPWAWPEDYRIPIDSNIVGIGVFGSTVVVATDGFTYTFTGPHPTSLYKTKLSFQPCLSQRGVVETDEGVIFPAPEGFQHVTSAGIANVTAELFSPKDWTNYELDTIHGTWYNKAYYGFYKSNDYAGHIIIDFLNGAVTTGVAYHYAGYVSLQGGSLQTIYESDITLPSTLYISTWDNNPTAYRNFDYKSPRYIFEKPVNMKVAQVILDSDFLTYVLGVIESGGELTTLNNAIFTASGTYDDDMRGPMNGSMTNDQATNGDLLYSLESLGVQGYVEFKLYADGVLKFTKQVTDSNMFKLPRGYKNKKWEVAVSGMIPVKRITIATSTEEIV